MYLLYFFKMKNLYYIFFSLTLLFFSSCEDESEENTTPDGLIGTTWTKRFYYIDGAGNEQQAYIMKLIFDSNTSFQRWDDFGDDGFEYDASADYVLSDNILYITNDYGLCDTCPSNYTAMFNGESIIIYEVIDQSGFAVVSTVPGENETESGPWVFIQE
jgi:hypothetical protein